MRSETLRSMHLFRYRDSSTFMLVPERKMSVFSCPTKIVTKAYPLRSVPWTRMGTLSLRSHDSWIFSISIYDRKGCHQKGESISNSKTRRNPVQRSQSDVMRSCPRKSTILADFGAKVWDTVYLEFPFVIFQNAILELRTNHKKSLIFSKLKSPCCRPFKGLHGLMPRILRLKIARILELATP